MRLFLAIFAMLLISSIARADPPYLVKEGAIGGLNGEVIIKEKRYGYGTTAEGTASFQLRLTNGAVIANSPVADNVASFCPSIRFCWVFPYSFETILASGWKLDPDKIAFDAPVPKYGFTQDQASAFQEYLKNDSQTSARGYAFGYPEHSNPHSGFSLRKSSIAFSPLLIIADQIIPLVAFIILSIIMCCVPS